MKYAAMTSRFTLEKLADLHARFLERTSHEQLTNEEAEEKLQADLAPDVESRLNSLRDRGSCYLLSPTLIAPSPPGLAF